MQSMRVAFVDKRINTQAPSRQVHWKESSLPCQGRFSIQTCRMYGEGTWINMDKHTKRSVSIEKDFSHSKRFTGCITVGHRATGPLTAESQVFHGRFGVSMAKQSRLWICWDDDRSLGETPGVCLDLLTGAYSHTEIAISGQSGRIPSDNCTQDVKCAANFEQESNDSEMRWPVYLRLDGAEQITSLQVPMTAVAQTWLPCVFFEGFSVRRGKNCILTSQASWFSGEQIPVPKSSVWRWSGDEA